MSETPSSYYRSSIKRSKRDFSVFLLEKGDWKALEESIIECPFQPYCFSVVGVALELWYEWMYKLMSSTFPKNTKHCMRLAPWVSNQSSNLIKVKYTLEKTSHQPRSKAKLEKVSEDLKVNLEENKLGFEKDLFHSSIFSNIQKYQRSVRKQTNLTSQMYFQNTQASNGLTKAQLFNTYFQYIFSRSTY